MPLHTRRLVPLALATAVAQTVTDVYPQPDRDHTKHRIYFGHGGHCYRNQCGWANLYGAWGGEFYKPNSSAGRPRPAPVRIPHGATRPSRPASTGATEADSSGPGPGRAFGRCAR